MSANIRAVAHGQFVTYELDLRGDTEEQIRWFFEAGLERLKGMGMKSEKEIFGAAYEGWDG